jgi:hypothetical protein
VQQVGLGGASLIEHPCPHLGQVLVGGVIHRREDAVGSPRAIFIGRMQGSVGAQRIGAREGGGTIERADIQSGEEGAGVTGVAWELERARDDRDLPPLCRQGTGKRACDLGRATTWVEEEAHEDAGMVVVWCCVVEAHTALLAGARQLSATVLHEDEYRPCW